jgi:hypothetical protein
MRRWLTTLDLIGGTKVSGIDETTKDIRSRTY